MDEVCKELYEKMIKAQGEWIQLSKNFGELKVDIVSEGQKLPGGYIKDIRTASLNEIKARKAYLKALVEWIKCRRSQKS